MTDLNHTLFTYLHSFTATYPAIIPYVIFFASVFGTLVVVAAILFRLFHRDFKPGTPFSLGNIRYGIGEVITGFLTAGISWLVAIILKYIVHAPRPYLVFENFHSLFPYGAYDSFPSGHATFFMGLATAIFLYHKKAGLWFGLAALIIGLARIVAGVHFPVDILAGYSIGILIALWVHYPVKRFISKLTSF